jgi:hypothetical protein
MPMIIPVVAAWAGAAGAVGAIAAGTATFASYLAVAGAALTTIGAVTGKKDLMKIGGFMSLGGALANGFGQAAATEAGSEVAADAATDAAASEIGNGALTENAMNASAQGAETLGQGLAGDFTAGSMLESGAYGVGANSATAASPLGLSPAATGAQTLATEASSTTGALDWLNKVGSHVKQNKELYQISGQMLQGMFGPDAELIDLKKQEMERRRKNANTIIPLGQVGMIGTLGRV